MHGYPRWRWHLDEAFVKTQRQALLSLARRWSRRRGLGVGGHSEAGQSRGAEVSQARHEDIWAPAERRQRRALLLPRGDEKDRLRIVERSAVGLNNRAENSHQPFRRRERACTVRSMKTLQQFSSVHARVHNHFNQERHLVTRQVFKQRRLAALIEWRALPA
jgi:putative transposase